MSTAEEALEAHTKLVRAATWDWQEAECIGFFGYGNGKGLPFARADSNAGGSGELPCSTCPKGQACWDAHKRKAGGIFVMLTLEFEKMAETVQGPELMQRWMASHSNRPDPYTAIMMTNMEAAAASLPPEAHHGD